jgi:hypothetical protein
MKWPSIEGHRSMKRQIAVALCAGMFGFAVPSALAVSQQKTAKACLQEWRANKAAKEANGITQKAYLAQCRAGGASDRAGAGPASTANPPGGSGNAGRDRPFHSSIKELMESIIDPSADALWGAVGTVLDKEGTHEMLPKTQEEWFDVRRAAVRIIEGANLLMMPGREAAPAGTKSEAPGVELEPPQMTALIKKNQKGFEAFARALQAVGLEALRAADSKDVPQLMDVGARMENVCESCHQAFWYPQEKRPN